MPLQQTSNVSYKVADKVHKNMNDNIYGAYFFEF